MARGLDAVEDMEDPSQSEPTCSECGADLEWQNCSWCDGSGVADFDALLRFDDPLDYAPANIELCPKCDGTGGAFYCPHAPHEERP